MTFGPSQLTLTCISTGGPATTVTWTRNSTTVTKGTVTVLNDPVTAQYTHTLSVTTAGDYTCVVSNNKPSSDSASITLYSRCVTVLYTDSIGASYSSAVKAPTQTRMAPLVSRWPGLLSLLWMVPLATPSSTLEATVVVRLSVVDLPTVTLWLVSPMDRPTPYPLQPPQTIWLVALWQQWLLG